MIRDLFRDNIKTLVPYSCARDEFKGVAKVYLDANESYKAHVDKEDINRYPDPRSEKLRIKIEEVLKIPFEKTVVTNGSDESIDLLFRIFCTPGKDTILLLPPTYGAYRVFADINDVAYITVNLTEGFGLDKEATIKAIKENTPKLTFICSPNNPTGNAMKISDIKEIADANPGITVVDEAYFDFSDEESAVSLIDENERVVVLRTLSKAWGLAGARIGMCIASNEIHNALLATKYPYNVSLLTQNCAEKALSKKDSVNETIKEIRDERKRVSEELLKFSFVEKIFRSDSNFILVRVNDANNLYKYLQKNGVIVRNRDKEVNCKQCLRITIGSKLENNELLSALEKYDGSEEK